MDLSLTMGLYSSFMTKGPGQFVRHETVGSLTLCYVYVGLPQGTNLGPVSTTQHTLPYHNIEPYCPQAYGGKLIELCYGALLS